MNTLIVYIKLIRAKHWIKNILIFLPLIFVLELSNTALLIKSFIGFLSFSFLASAVYVINDLLDLSEDKKHKEKKNRPLASGVISKNAGIFISCFLLLCSFALDAAFYDFNFAALSVLAAYLILNISYSFYLKHLPIIDIVILSSGFVLRVLYGSLITGIPISNWLYLVIIAFSLTLGIGKRRNEISLDSRPVLKKYTRDFLDKTFYMCMAITIMFYSLWTLDSKTIIAQTGVNLIWTVPLVLIICIRYSFCIEVKEGGDPVEVLLNDKILLFLTLIYAASILFILYR
ncbi:MAG: UbiA prenyltransferase family protein [Elusimicrobiota bacterium]|jgi:4-hydroxybenzoate polyprenyltransferase|nr:UbiA prenyltransferase family protein [Elusimicrobiota bacterium]